MIRFTGKYSHSVDQKGRISLPVKLRKGFTGEPSEHFYITRGMGKSLEIYPSDEWLNQQKKIGERINPFDPVGRKFLTALSSHTHELQIDRQQRLSIPPDLLLFAEISDAVVIVGLMNKIALWSPANYEEYLQDVDYDSISAQVMGGE